MTSPTAGGAGIERKREKWSREEEQEFRPAENALQQFGRGLGNTLGRTISLAVTIPSHINDVTLGQ